MDAGHNSSRLEQAVLAAERKVVTRTPWYNHRAIWGTVGLIIGLAASPLYQQVLTPEKASAREPQIAQNAGAQSAAQRLISDLNLRTPLEKQEELKPEEPKADKLAQAIKEIRGEVPFSPRNLEALPAVMPNPTLQGPLRVEPYRPDLQALEIQETKPAAPKERSPDDLEKERKITALQSQIGTLRAQRDELLKSFYEDAIPVKHVDQDIVKVEEEIRKLENQ